MRTCVHVHVYLQACVFLGACACVCVHARVCVYVCTCVHECMCIYGKKMYTKHAFMLWSPFYSTAHITGNSLIVHFLLMWVQYMYVVYVCACVYSWDRILFLVLFVVCEYTHNSTHYSSIFAFLPQYHAHLYVCVRIVLM